MLHLYYVTNKSKSAGMYIIASDFEECKTLATEALKKDSELAGFDDSYWKEVHVEFVREFRYSSQVVCWDEV